MRDHFGREITYLRLSVTENCNLRCRYCMPEGGICQGKKEQMLTDEEMVQAAEAAASLGIRKIRITGGEPLVKKNIVSICERIAKIPGIEEVCLTTNGVLLEQYAPLLKAAGVKRINVSLDTLDQKKYASITGRDHLTEAIRGLETALICGFEQVKLNTVLIGGFNDDEVEQIAGLADHYGIDVRFIELMPMYDGGDFGEEAFLSNETVLKKLPELQPVSGGDGVARMYQLQGKKGRIGLISPVNDHFCMHCNRIRLTADGKLKPCLHSEEEITVKGLDQDAMREAMQEAILSKPFCHAELSAVKRSHSGRNMNRIGG